MKKFFLLVVLATLTATTVFANQSMSDKKVLKKSLKDAKTEAKKLDKEGWRIIGADRSIELQMQEGVAKRAEKLKTRKGEETERYIEESATSVGGSQANATAAARNTCYRQISEDLEVKIAAILERVSGQDAVSGVGTDELTQKAKAITNAALTNTKPVLSIYRPKGDKYEAKVTILFDKQELAKRITEEISKQLKDKANQLGQAGNEVIDIQ